MITVHLPDGRTIQVNTDDPEVAAKAAHTFRSDNPHPQPERSLKNTLGGFVDDAIDGILPGAAGAVHGAIDVAANAVRAPFSSSENFHPAQAYREGRAYHEARQKQVNADHPGLASTAQVAGMIGGLTLPASKVARGATLAQKVGAGMKTAGAYSALSGALSSKRDSLPGVLSDAVLGGGIGALTGAALPLVVKAAGAVAQPIKPLVQPVARGIGRGLQAASEYLPGQLGRLAASEGAQLARSPAQATARQMVDTAIRSEINPATGRNWTPMQAVQEAQNRQRLGTPAVLADTHEGTRKAFGTAARSPGPALSSVRRMIDQRQEASGGRLSDAVREHLGPAPDNLEPQAQMIRQRAQDAARPHYEEAYAAPGASDSQLAEIVGNRSQAMRDAISHAHELALRENRDPTALGFDIAPLTNEVSLNRVPSFETLDLVKRGLNDVADRTRDPFGNLSNDGRTINAMAGPLVRRMREVNPAYGRALDEYGGEIAGRDALLAGENSLKSGASDISHATRDMSPYARQNFALGHRSAMANDLSTFGRATPYGNAAARLRQNYGNPGSDTYRALQGIHGADAVDNLALAGEAEHQAHQTYKAVRGTSALIDRAAEAAAQESAIQGASKGFWQALSGRPGQGTMTALGSLMKGDRNAAEANGIAAGILSETQPDAMVSAVRGIGREKARKALVKQRQGALLSQAAKSLGALSSAAMVQPFEDPDDSDVQ